MLIRILQPFRAYPDDLTGRDFRPGEVLEIARLGPADRTRPGQAARADDG
jgi:hypothetical protein